MSLRPRGGPDERAAAPAHDVRFNHAVGVLKSRTTGAPTQRTSSGFILSAHVPAATGAFVSVPDTREHEDLARRVAALEARDSTASISSLKASLDAHIQAYAQLVSRVGTLETRLADVAGDCKRIEAEVSSHSRGDLRAVSLVNQLHSEIDKLRSQFLRHQHNEEIHDHSEHGHAPKGFQENDEPRRFMQRVGPGGF